MVATSSVKIIVADDHPVVREGLRFFLNEKQGFQVVAEAGDNAEVVKTVSLYRPNVLILGLLMREGYSFEVIKELKKQYPEMFIIVYSVFAEESFVYRALQAGASGYIDKCIHPRRVIEAIQAVIRGEIWLDVQCAVNDLQESKRYISMAEMNCPLTKREICVIALVAEGLSNKQIGMSLGIKERTVKQHLYNAIIKLQAHNRVHAVMIANRLGILKI